MENKQYVGFWDRFHAVIVTATLLSIIEMFFSYFIFDDFWMNSYDYFTLQSLPIEILSLAIIVYFWNRYMSDPGKMLFKATIVDATTYEKATLKQYILRYLGYYISLLPLGLGFWWVIWDKKKQSWHDKIANTVVIKPEQVPKKIAWYTMLYRVVISLIMILIIIGALLLLVIPEDKPLLPVNKLNSEKIQSIKKNNYLNMDDLLYYYESHSLFSNSIEYIIVIYKKEVCTIFFESDKLQNKDCYAFKDMKNLKVSIEEDGYVSMYDGSIYTDDYLNSDIYYEGNDTEDTLNEVFYIDEKDTHFKEKIMKLWKKAKGKDKNQDE